MRVPTTPLRSVQLQTAQLLQATWPSLCDTGCNLWHQQQWPWGRKYEDPEEVMIQAVKPPGQRAWD